MAPLSKVQQILAYETLSIIEQQYFPILMLILMKHTILFKINPKQLEMTKYKRLFIRSIWIFKTERKRKTVLLHIESIVEALLINKV